MTTSFRNPVLLALCFALVVVACKNSSPVDSASTPGNPVDTIAVPGNLWQLCNAPAFSRAVDKFVTGRNGILFALAGGAVAKSADSGKTWSAVTASTSGFTDLIADKGGNLYLCAQGIYRSTDDGKSWTNLGLNQYVSSLTMIANGWILVVGYDVASCYLSKNDGQSWVKTSDLGGYGWRVIYNQKANKIYLKTDFHGSTVKLWSSIDNGTTWSYDQYFPSYGTNSTPNFCMAVDSSGRLWVLDQEGTVFLNSLKVGGSSFGGPLELQVDPSGLLLQGGNGFHFSSNGGVSWTTKSSGLTDSAVTGIGITPSGLILVGTGTGKIFRAMRAITQ
jgi:hypothetical protein